MLSITILSSYNLLSKRFAPNVGVGATDPRIGSVACGTPQRPAAGHKSHTHARIQDTQSGIDPDRISFLLGTVLLSVLSDV